MARPSAAQRATSVTIGQMAKRANYEVLDAGRQVIQASSRRWRRVADSKPCGWCAMLASRGPVYKSADTADGGRYHAFCGCTAEPFDGDPSTWEPTAAEKRFIEAYEASYESGMSKEALALRMDDWLRAHPDLDDAAGWTSLDDDVLDALMLRKMDEGDYLGAERIGEILDSRFTDAAGRRVDVMNPFTDDVYGWYAKTDATTQARFTDKLEELRGYDAGQMFQQQAYAFTHTRGARSGLPTPRQMRAQYADWLEVEWQRAEAATNGYMLNEKGKAKGISIRDLWRLKNPKTAQQYATRELLDYWNANGRLSYEDFRAGYAGAAETTANLMKGAWV